MLNWIVWNRTVWLSVSTRYVYKSYIQYICENKIKYWITKMVDMPWNQTKPNFNQYICHYFESPLAIYQVAYWFHASKIQLMSSTRSFLCFYQSFLRKFFLSFRAFCSEHKRWKSLGARSGKYSGEGRMNLLKSHIFSCVILVECGFALLQRSTTFLRLTIAQSAGTVEYTDCCSAEG